MGLTVRDALVYALENLEKMGFKKFRKQLHEIEVKENYRRIPRGKLEDKDRGDIADLIREYYKDVYGAEVTLAVLDKINEKKVAEELEEDLRKVRPMALHLSDTGEMMCSITLETFYPGYLHTEWKECGGEKSEEVLSSQELYKESPDHRSFSVCSEVRISQDSLTDPESTVHVSWEHEYTNTKGRQTFSIKDQDFHWRPVVGDIQTPPCLYHNTLVVLQCEISGYYPDGLTMKWFKKYKQNLELYEESDDVLIPQITSNKNPDNTYSCTARLIMTPTLSSHQGAEYICQVEHPSLEKAIKKSTGGVKMLDLPWTPDVDEIFVLRLEDNLRTRMMCSITGYFPDTLTVSWYKKENGVVSAVQDSGDIATKVKEHKMKNKTYSCTATLLFTPDAEKDQGSEFICRVEHPILEHPIERSNGPLRILRLGEKESL
ncbi:uncharacterized protein [Dendropsophus ebraccatus]|uniref:uncharacterized protein isoform X2 n=1 Tax=Dendropsophus ebraccatus TaxID=150705 RepID=UPI0038314C92